MVVKELMRTLMGTHLRTRVVTDACLVEIFDSLLNSWCDCLKNAMRSDDFWCFRIMGHEDEGYRKKL